MNKNKIAKYIDFITQDVERIHLKPFLRISILSHCQRYFKGQYAPKVITKIVDSYFWKG